MLAENDAEQEAWYEAISELMNQSKRGFLEQEDHADQQVDEDDEHYGAALRPGTVFKELMNIRRCGHSENFFFIEVGRSASIGPGELWMQVDDSVVAQNMHETFLDTMKALKAFAEFRPRSKSQSSGGGSGTNPISFITTRRHLGNLPPSQTGLQRRSRTESVAGGTPPTTKSNNSYRFRTSSEGEGTMTRPFRSVTGSLIHLNTARMNLGRQEGSGSSGHGSASDMLTRPSSSSVCGSPSDGGFISSDEYGSSPGDFRYFRVDSRGYMMMFPKGSSSPVRSPLTGFASKGSNEKIVNNEYMDMSPEGSPSSLGSSSDHRQSPLSDYMSVDLDVQSPKAVKELSNSLTDISVYASSSIPRNQPNTDYARLSFGAACVSTASNRTDDYTEMTFNIAATPPRPFATESDNTVKMDSPSSIVNRLCIVDRYAGSSSFSVPSSDPPIGPKVIRADPQGRRRHSSETFSSAGTVMPSSSFFTDSSKRHSSASFDNVWLKPDENIADGQESKMSRDTSTGFQNGLNYIALNLRNDPLSCEASTTVPACHLRNGTSGLDSGAYAHMSLHSFLYCMVSAELNPFIWDLTDCIAMETIVGKEDFLLAGPDLAALLSQLLSKPHGALEWLRHVPNGSARCLLRLTCAMSLALPPALRYASGHVVMSSAATLDHTWQSLWPWQSRWPFGPRLSWRTRGTRITFDNNASSNGFRSKCWLNTWEYPVKYLGILERLEPRGHPSFHSDLDDQDPPEEKSPMLFFHVSSSREPEWNRWLGDNQAHWGLWRAEAMGTVSEKVVLVFLVDLVDPADQGIPGNLVLPSDLEVQGVLVGQVAQVSPEALVVQGVLDILELLGHLEDREYRSLEDLDPPSPLECLAALDNVVKTQPFSKRIGDHMKSNWLAPEEMLRTKEHALDETFKPALYLLNSTQRPTHLEHQEALDGQIHLGCPFHQVSLEDLEILGHLSVLAARMCKGTVGVNREKEKLGGKEMVKRS
ncbi:hypothetical protein IHE44_0003169 [Lamprotornis superbus]|uniref:PH domain-containing protein n=1 Tax=Lamprotornis superbus TaxID=245042 RepID=A0A835NP09_9PASS|nr:hypothetical protein IHE44_0003169 [Lamprotornis superbus]